MHPPTRHDTCALRDCRSRGAPSTLFPFQQTETLLCVQECTHLRFESFALAWVTRRRRADRRPAAPLPDGRT